MLDNDPYNILENEFVKPGKGQAFNRVKLRNLKTGRVLERTFKSGDSVEGADVADMDALVAAMKTEAMAEAMAYDGVVGDTLVILVEA